MGNKKKTGRAKAWKLTSEPVHPSVLSLEEEQLFADAFFWNEMFGMGGSPLFGVSAAIDEVQRECRTCLPRIFLKTVWKEIPPGGYCGGFDNSGLLVGYAV